MIKLKLSTPIILFFALLCFSGCVENNKSKETHKSVELISSIGYSVINKYPHSINSFTEGLLVHNNQLFESTGAPSEMPSTRSLFGVLSLESGEIDVKGELNRSHYFGEGISILNDKIYQLTYKKQTCFVYDLNTFENIKQFRYSNKEGWGMTTDGKYLIMSDGTNKITYRNPDDFSEVKTVSVSEKGFAVDYINELEYIKGNIYANIWQTDRIVKINPESGVVVGELDVSSLRKMVLNENPYSLETNGIAYDSLSNSVYVTGKMWPKVFELKLAEY